MPDPGKRPDRRGSGRTTLARDREGWRWPQYTSWSTFIGERKMEKKLSGSSRRGTLTSVKAEDIFNKPLTKRERETVRRTAERQVAGDDLHIDYSDIPPLTDEQLAAMTRFRDARDRLEKKKMISLYLRGDVLNGSSPRGRAI